MDGELDYMSDEFLKSCAGPSKDVRPGLIKSLSQKREHELLNKKKHLDEIHKKNHKPQTIVQAERLEEGLQQPISSSNKGYSMLEKMGFKPGTGLGKTNSGIVEPVAISIKNDRKGLGRTEALKQIKIRKKNIRLKHESNSVEDYRASLSKKNKEREVASDLRKSQRICHQLDMTSGGINSPTETWFWPEDCALPDEKSSDSNSEEDEEEDQLIEFEPSEKLEILTGYLRQAYCYCIWCGVQYDDEKDLQDCPGPTREDH